MDPAAAIRTERLALEPLTRAHATEMFAALSNPAIYLYIEESPPPSLEALTERYGRLESRRSGDGRELWLNWVVREAATGKAAGYVQATVLEDHTAHVAYVIAPAMQGRGYGREATAAMIRELRSRHGAGKLRACIDCRNAASIALVLSLGFCEVSGQESGDRHYEL